MSAKSTAAKTVVVTGDVVRHEGLAVTTNEPEWSLDDRRRPRIDGWQGGAWRVARFVRWALADLAPKPQVVGPRRDARAGRSIALWSLEPREATASKKDKVWRIQRLLGTEVHEPGRLHTTDIDPQAPELVVIDDLGLGFCGCKEVWPSALQPGGNPGHIVWKMSARSINSALWKTVIERFADRLSVVVLADLLRNRGAFLSAALSWDLTIEQIVREFESGVSRGDLALARRTVVVFDRDGAACFTRLPLYGNPGDPGPGRARFERCLYDPANLEGVWSARRPGGSPAVSALVAASLARYELCPETSSLFVAVGRGLAAARALHDTGGGNAERPSMDHAESVVRQCLKPEGKEESDPSRAYKSAFPHSILNETALHGQADNKSDLLRDVTGAGMEFVLAKAMQVVIYGEDFALAAAPRARYGKYLTVDREDFAVYRRNKRETIPLCLPP